MELQSLYLKENQTEKIERAEKSGTTSFWERQFQVDATNKQKIFDGIFGIVLPVVCFFFDPVVFRGNGALLGTFKPFAYLLSYISIMGLLAFMFWGKKLKWLSGVLSGLFAISAIISIAIGIALLPFSVIGLMFIIGVLGFTPLFMGFVFWRNSVRAFKTAQPVLGTKLLVNTIILSSILSFTIPEIINVKIYKGLETIKTGDAQTIRRTTKRLKFFAPILNAESLGKRYYAVNQDQERELALAEACLELDGRDIANQKWRVFKIIQ